MKPIKNILIIGDTVAGWMTAAFLSKILNAEGSHLNITLSPTDKPDTTPTHISAHPMLNGFFSMLGNAEDQWMEKCYATFSMATRFDKWYNNGKDDAFWHSFGQFRGNIGPSLSIMHYWLDRHLRGDQMPFAKAVHDAIYACEVNAAPKPALSQARKGMPPIPYGYHLDTKSLISLLKEIALQSKVIYLQENIRQVHRNENQFIQSVQTNTNKLLQADLFINCTGYASLPGDNQAPNGTETHNSLASNHLIELQIPYDEEDPFNEKNGGIQPYTTATALSAGWAGHYPLIEKEGWIYAFDSNHLSSEKAVAELKSFIGNKANQAVVKSHPIYGHIKEFPWEKNSIAIGQAAASFEPLEANILSSIQLGIQFLIQHFPDCDFDSWHADAYNQKMRDVHQNINDFLTLHYVLTQREDTPFWKTMKQGVAISKSLEEMLTEWKTHWITEKDLHSLYGPYNYISILAGMHYLPPKALPATAFYRTEANRVLFESIIKSGEQLAKTLPTQAEYFRKIKRIKEFQANAAW